MRYWELICVSLTAAAALLTAPAGAVTFDDGMVHVIDAGNSYPFEDVDVFDGPLAVQTVVAVVAGGEIGQDLQLFDSSYGSLEGGTILGDIRVFDNSEALVTSGSTGRIWAVDHSRAVMTNGNVDLLYASSPDPTHVGVTLSGGTAGQITAEGGRFEILGGVVTGQVTVAANGPDRPAHGSVQGGSLGSVRVLGPSTLDLEDGEVVGLLYLRNFGAGDEPANAKVSGGSVLGGVQVDGSSSLEIVGGAVAGQLLVTNTGTITLAGTGFSLPYGDIVMTAGSLTGFLAEGTPVNVTFARASTATITLACPGLGFLSPTTPSLAADQDNYCEDWANVWQPEDDLSRAGLELVDLTLANLSGALLVDADLTDANLSGADLIGADLTGAILFGAMYDESTLFPSGNTYDIPPWGLDGGVEPWNSGMIPVPEPSIRLLALFGSMGLAGLAAMKGSV